MSQRRFQGWMVLVMAIAAFLRLVYLGSIPSCLEYDEAAIAILAGEIAQGKAHPIFIRAYTGQEVLYHYLAAGTMLLAGVTPFALRLTSVFLGLLTVALTGFCARELATYAGREDSGRHDDEGRWLGLFSAALVAVSYWQVNLSRFGYRAVVLPPLLTLTAGAALRGLRTGRWRWIVTAGLAAGLSAHTYSSVRVFPLLLLALWGWVLVADRRQARLRLRQLALFGLAAALVFAPLGLFFLRNPETFSVRLSQVSVLSPAVHHGDLWGALGTSIRLAFGMFTVAGDLNPLYNLPGKPVFDRLLGPFFYLGLLACAWRLVRPARRRRAEPSPSRLPYFLLLAWLLVMMVPNILSASGVPHNLRAMSLLPAVFIVPALGILSLACWVKRILPRAQWTSAVLPFLLIALLVGEGWLTYRDYVHRWALSAAPYYKGNEALLHAARLIDAHPQATPYVASYFQQHATLAMASQRYSEIRWLSGATLVLPAADASPALLIYDHTNPVDPLLRQQFLPIETLLHRELGPDGETAYEAFWLDTAHRPAPVPQYPLETNMGHTLTLLGYDLNAPAQADGTLDVTLYLRVLRPVDRDDYAFFAHLVDDLGFHWGGDTFFEYPSAQWRTGEVLIMRRQISIAAGAPPGDYALDVGVFSASLDARLPVLNQAGQMVGTTASLGPIRIERAKEPPTTLPAIQQPQQVAFGEALTYLGSDRDRSDLRPGETLALTLYWQAGRLIEAHYAVSVWLAGDAAIIPLWQGDPVHGRYPFARWQPGEFVRDRYALRLPLDTPAGDYHLRIALLDNGGEPSSADRPDPTMGLSLGTIHVHATDRLWEPPPVGHVVGARLGDVVELVGYDLEPDAATPGETLHLTLVWRCLGAMDTAYTVFTHLLDPNEQIRGQKDNPPVSGSYPTTLWVSGEVVIDRYDITVAADAPPSQAVIEVGMYDPATMQRLPVYDPTAVLGDRILLATIQIGK